MYEVDYRYFGINIDPMEFNTATEAIEFKNFLLNDSRERCISDIMKILGATGETKIRRIRLFNNLQVFNKNVHPLTGIPYPCMPDQNGKWGIRFIVGPYNLLDSFQTYTMPVGDPALLTSWIFTFSAFDENLEPISPLVSNGGITIYPSEE